MTRDSWATVDGLGCAAWLLSGCESCVKTADALFDVVTDEAHALDAVDAAFGGFVGVPVLEAGSGKGVDVGFAPQCDDDVDVAGQLQVDGFGVWSVMSWGGCRTWAERSLTAVPGLVPAEYTATVSPAIWRISPAARCDLPAFLTQTNSTKGGFIGSVSAGGDVEFRSGGGGRVLVDLNITMAR